MENRTLAVLAFLLLAPPAMAFDPSESTVTIMRAPTECRKHDETAYCTFDNYPWLSWGDATPHYFTARNLPSIDIVSKLRYQGFVIWGQRRDVQP